MKIAVYTCITGGYDSLKEIPEQFFEERSLDYICFTDNSELKSKTWKIRPIPKELEKITKTKQQRIIKVLPQKYLSEYDASLWIDGNIEIKQAISTMMKICSLDDFPLWTLKHPRRNCIYEEEKAVLNAKKDVSSITSIQIKKYFTEGYPKNNGLAETRILWRTHKNQKLNNTSYCWATEILRGSHRDQLSFNYVCWKNGLKYGEISKEIFTRYFIVRKHGQIQEERNANVSLPPISIMMTTHNRTRVACTCLNSLTRNIKYDGKIKWIICDDLSFPGHVEALENVFKIQNIKDYVILKTTDERYGLGASMNNGLHEAWKYGNIVLTTEDDWLLVRNLNLNRYVNILFSDNSIGGIRLGALCPLCGSSLTNTKYNDLKKINGKNDSGRWYIFNNQVMLRHKRVFDKIGYMKENCPADNQEKDLVEKFNKVTNFGTELFSVLWPADYDIGTLYGIHNPFFHIGYSTTSGKYRTVRQEYIQLNDQKLDEEFRQNILRQNILNKEEMIIVSMTSYPKNINYVAKSIWLLNNKQTLKPDEIHLWLSIKEFPNKEKDLPNELNETIRNSKNLFVHWLEKNTYVHKRHEIFKIIKSGCVFFIDDDTEYDEHLIETVMQKHKEFPTAIISYTKYSTHEYNGRRILYKNSKYGNGPLVNKARWCGQSMIPFNIYPKDCLSDKNQNIRDNTSPISDECWFQPWVVWNDIPIYYLNFGWGKNISPNSQKNGLISYSHTKDSNGYEKRDNWLYNVLSKYPHFYKKYQRLFNYGN